MGDRTQRIKGKVNEGIGKAELEGGAATGSTGERLKGAARIAKGKTQQVVGKARSGVKKSTR